MTGTPVKIYLYDVSQGMARAWSMSLIGKHIEGVWHTGVVTYGDEYYFGSQGIEYCPPTHTILGEPDQIFDMGHTHIPKEIFIDYINELSSGRYKPECYSLFEHNCNNFSSEIAQFLTGQDIPSFITNLPKEVLETPFGQMIRPIIDSVKVTPAGGSHVFSRETSPAEGPSVPTDAATGQCYAGQYSAGQCYAKPDSGPSYGVIIGPGCRGERWISNVEFLRSNFSALYQVMLLKVTKQEMSVLNEFKEYILTPEERCTWSISAVHIQLLCSTLLCHHKDLDVRSIQVVLCMLHQSVVRSETQHIVCHDKTMSLIKVLTLLHKLPADTHEDVATLLLNCSSSSQCHQWMTDTSKWPDGSSEMINSEVVIFVLTTLLRSSDRTSRKITSMAACNLASRKVSEDTAEKIAVCVTECLTKKPEPDTAENCLQTWKSLLPYMKKEALSRIDIKEVHMLNIAAQSKTLNDLCVDIRMTVDRMIRAC